MVLEVVSHSQVQEIGMVGPQTRALVMAAAAIATGTTVIQGSMGNGLPVIGPMMAHTMMVMDLTPGPGQQGVTNRSGAQKRQARQSRADVATVIEAVVNALQGQNQNQQQQNQTQEEEGWWEWHNESRRRRRGAAADGDGGNGAAAADGGSGTAAVAADGGSGAAAVAADGGPAVAANGPGPGAAVAADGGAVADGGPGPVGPAPAPPGNVAADVAGPPGRQPFRDLDCPICLMPIGPNSMAFFPCIHGPFHKECARRCLLQAGPRCPVCRNLALNQ